MESDGEAARLAALYATAVLDTPPEADFDDIAAIASDICGTPIGMVSLVDGDRQWAKAGVGWDGSPQTPRDLSFCARAIEHPGIYGIGDAVTAADWAANPLVTDEGVRFYAGAPLILRDRPAPEDGAPGLAAGTVCVLDREPRHLSSQRRRARQSRVAADPQPTLTVADTGVGIPAADLPHVFERFHRSAAADDLASQGAGVGLAIVEAIVDAHGGTIAVAGSTATAAA
nr:hypothetical protein GCM10020063_051050 [Dactylosporangium thailandense]